MAVGRLAGGGLPRVTYVLMVFASKGQLVR